jgi:predicted dehydrogenase
MTIPHPIRVGILGAARIAPFALVKPAQGRADFEVRCVAARDRHRAQAFAAKFGIPSVEESYGALLSRDDLDLIYVPLPPAMHEEWSIRALESGKAVLCEKPIAVTADQARRMVDTARRCRKPLIEAFHYRFHPVMLRAIALVEQKAFGRITSAEAYFEGATPYPDSLWSAELGCGALTDVGCYPIHALRTLLGEPRVLEATGRLEHGTLAEVDARLAFSPDVPARMFAKLTDVSPSGSRECWLRIVGEEGHMTITNFIVPHLYPCTFVTNIGGVERSEPVARMSTYEAQLDYVSDVLSRNARELTGGADAIANMAAIDAIRAAIGAG